MGFSILQRCVVPDGVRGPLETLAKAGVVFDTVYRGEDAKALLHSLGLHTQSELYNATPEQRAAWGITGGVNPPGRSTHELRSDATAYPGPVGRHLADWQVGLDIANSDLALRVGAQHGWKLFRPYSTESWHLNFREKPTMNPFVEGVDTIAQNLDRILAMTYWQQSGRLVGSYTTRTYAMNPSQMTKTEIHIDQAPTDECKGNVKDIESGAASIQNAVNARKKGYWFAAYLPEFQDGFSLAECDAAMHRAGFSDQLYWVANWGDNQSSAASKLGGRVVGRQWAAPDSNPNTILPGTNLTLKQANADLSVWTPDALQRINRTAPAPVHAKGIWIAELHYDPEHRRANIYPQPGKNVKMAPHRVLGKMDVAVNENTGHWTVAVQK